MRPRVAVPSFTRVVEEKKNDYSILRGVVRDNRTASFYLTIY